MPVYLLTGKLGSGKSLAAVGRAAEYAEQGRRVVANFAIDLAPLARTSKSIYARSIVEGIPERPTSVDLFALGRGGPSEEKAGLLILDECATWLNARTWAGKDREAAINWFILSRRLGWDVILICQHASALDKQVRELICEYLVTCRRLDRFKIPLLPVRMPKVHVASVRYGLSPNDLNAEHWVYRGVRFYECYNTLWHLAENTTDGWCKTVGGAQASATWHSVLPAWHTRFRHLSKPVELAKRLIASRWWPVGVMLSILQSIPSWFIVNRPTRGAGLAAARPRGDRGTRPARDAVGRLARSALGGGGAFNPSTWLPGRTGGTTSG